MKGSSGDRWIDYAIWAVLVVGVALTVFGIWGRVHYPYERARPASSTSGSRFALSHSGPVGEAIADFEHAIRKKD